VLGAKVIKKSIRRKAFGYAVNLVNREERNVRTAILKRLRQTARSDY